MAYCPVCENYMYGPGHQCPPQWNVWEEDEADEQNTDEFRLVYADDAEEAATTIAHRMSDDGPFEGKLFVALWAHDEDDPGPARKFSLEPRYELQFSASEE